MGREEGLRLFSSTISSRFSSSRRVASQRAGSHARARLHQIQFTIPSFSLPASLRLLLRLPHNTHQNRPCERCEEICPFSPVWPIRGAPIAHAHHRPSAPSAPAAPRWLFAREPQVPKQRCPSILIWPLSPPATLDHAHNKMIPFLTSLLPKFPSLFLRSFPPSHTF